MALPRFLRRLFWIWSFFALFFVAVALLALFVPAAPAGLTSNQSIVLRDPSGIESTMVVEVADTPEERQQGLMERSVVERGMVFVFEEDAPLSFWMKNTLVPLDIAYFASNGTWVSSARMEPCTEDPCATYKSAGPAMYALELPAGGIGQAIGDGWMLDVQPGT